MDRATLWEEIPHWFYDNMLISKSDIEKPRRLSAYGRSQSYFGKNISPRGVNEFLFGDNIRDVKLLSLRSIDSAETKARGVLTIEAAVKLPDGNNGTIRHTFNRLKQSISFDYIKPENPDEKFPDGFGREFFRRYVPALRELGIREINIKASSVPSAGMNGAYTWCFYGFTNKQMRGTLEKYIHYLENYYGIYLDGMEIGDIMKMRRMKDFAVSEIKGRRYAEEFLKAKRRGSMEWPGIIPDIFDEDSYEMDELIRYLSGGK